MREGIPHILVIGDLMVDHYIWGKSERISPEAPVQVVEVAKEENLLGGAGNVINNLLSLGSEVGVCSVIGSDQAGEFIKQRLQERGIKQEVLIRSSHRPTTKKSRIMAQHQQIVRIDREEKRPIDEEAQQQIIDRVNAVVAGYDLVVLSDYNKGVLTEYLTQEIIKISKSRQKPILIDPKGADFGKYRGATLLTPNKKEAILASGIEISDDSALRQVGEKLIGELGLESLIVTLSEEGMAIFEEGTMQKIPTVAREVYDVTGAGDTVLAALGYSLAKGESLFDAAKFANAAAAVVVGKVGAATATKEEILAYERAIYGKTEESKLMSREELIEILKNRNDKIVFTNGCFDILHAGHVRYLAEAKRLGDILIVGVNSDASVKRLKGESRPINTQEDRMAVLAGLEAVDFVVLFDEDTPYALISAIKPDILVKGADYEGKEIVGSDVAKETRLIDFVEGKSTTGVIEKIRRERLC